jgi:hypothetical protein
VILGGVSKFSPLHWTTSGRGVSTLRLDWTELQSQTNVGLLIVSYSFL